ncbi:MFS transporter [Acidiplasma sp.]|uniref:MFS transporter n=1 Tax=Acidiplasma sp. TaxID=1872114 RepID=UPI00259021F2|nr:MFS transporter [Acidiplasma sp.]
MFSDSPEEVNKSFKYLIISRATRSSALIFVTLALPLYLHFLNFSAVFIGLLYIPITLFNVFLTLILGRLGDKIGYSRILFLGEVFPVAGMLLMAVSANIYFIATGAIIAGITGGAGGMRGAFSPGMTAFVANNYGAENDRVGKLSLLLATASAFSIFGGLFLGSYAFIKNITGTIMFYRIFFFISFILVFISLISLSRLKEYRRPKKTTRVMKKQSLRYLIRIMLPNSINAAAIGISMPLLPLLFELKYHVDPSIIGYLYTFAYVVTALGSYISGKYINGMFDSLKIASIAHILQGALFIIIAFTPLFFLAGVIYIFRMGIAGVGSPMRGAINVRGIDREDYGTSTAIQGISGRASQLTSGASGYLMDLNFAFPLLIGGSLQALGGVLYYTLIKSWNPGKHDQAGKAKA